MTLRLTILVLLFLAACSSENPQLMKFPTSKTGPDEFLVAPSKPLAAPPKLAELPPPTPGGINLAAPTPNEDMVIALGGSVKALDQVGVPASDAGLVNYATRAGRDPQIRDTLAAEDLKYRQSHNGRLIDRLANVNVYYSAYGALSLSQQKELARLRAAGVPTPTAPPAELKPN